MLKKSGSVGKEECKVEDGWVYNIPFNSQVNWPHRNQNNKRSKHVESEIREHPEEKSVFFAKEILDKCVSEILVIKASPHAEIHVQMSQCIKNACNHYQNMLNRNRFLGSKDPEDRKRSRNMSPIRIIEGIIIESEAEKEEHCGNNSIKDECINEGIWMERAEEVESKSADCKSSNIADDDNAKAFFIWPFLGCLWLGSLDRSFTVHEKI